MMAGRSVRLAEAMDYEITAALTPFHGTVDNQAFSNG
jgi:hypothetical protein